MRLLPQAEKRRLSLVLWPSQTKRDSAFSQSPLLRDSERESEREQPAMRNRHSPLACVLRAVLAPCRPFSFSLSLSPSHDEERDMHAKRKQCGVGMGQTTASRLSMVEASIIKLSSA